MRANQRLRDLCSSSNSLASEAGSNSSSANADQDGSGNRTGGRPLRNLREPRLYGEITLAMIDDFLCPLGKQMTDAAAKGSNSSAVASRQPVFSLAPTTGGLGIGAHEPQRARNILHR